MQQFHLLGCNRIVVNSTQTLCSFFSCIQPPGHGGAICIQMVLFGFQTKHYRDFRTCSGCAGTRSSVHCGVQNLRITDVIGQYQNKPGI